MMGKRIVLLLLVCLLAFSACACGRVEAPSIDSLSPSSPTTGTTTGEAATTPTTTPNKEEETGIRPLNEKEAALLASLGDEGLGGYQFTVVDFDSRRFSKSVPGTPYADAWAQILDEVESLYNCKITVNTLSPSEMFTAILPEIAAGGKYADIIVTTQWAYGFFLSANCMMDLNQLDVNWDNGWWNQNLRQAATFGGTTKVAAGSFLSDAAQTVLLYYNKAIWDACGFEDPYKLVEEGRWTQDLFAEYCRRAALDRDNSGDLDSLDDRWGVIGFDTGNTSAAWYMGMGGRYFTADSSTGRVKLACNSQRAFDIVDSMFHMSQKDKTSCLLGFHNDAERISKFSEGGSLFYAGLPGIGELQQMPDDWGVLPLPKFSADQSDYLSGVDHNSAVFGVAATNQDLREVSILLEALGEHAQILEDIYWPDYSDSYWRDEKDARLFSHYIVGHGQYDLSHLLQQVNSVFGAPIRQMQTALGNDENGFASWVDYAAPSIDQVLTEFFGY